MGAKDSLGVKSFRAGDQTWCPRESAVAKLILGLLGRVSQRRHDCDRVSQSGRRSRAGGIPVSRAAGMPVPAARLPCDRVMCPAPSPPKKMPDLSHTQPMGTREPRHRSWGRSGWEFQTPTRGSKVCLALRSVWAARRLSHCASSSPALALLLQVFLFLLDSSQLALLTLPAGTKHYAPPPAPSLRGHCNQSRSCTSRPDTEPALSRVRQTPRLWRHRTSLTAAQGAGRGDPSPVDKEAASCNKVGPVWTSGP